MQRSIIYGSMRGYHVETIGGTAIPGTAGTSGPVQFAMTSK